MGNKLIVSPDQYSLEEENALTSLTRDQSTAGRNS